MRRTALLTFAIIAFALQTNASEDPTGSLEGVKDLSKDSHSRDMVCSFDLLM